MDVNDLKHDTIVFAGDWHANWRWAKSAMNWAKNMYEANVILHAGDFGYNFTPSYLAALNDYAEKIDMHILFVDGNHENFDRLETFPINEHGVRPLRDRVIHLPRGFRWNWDGLDYMSLGGAHSIDRIIRGRIQRYWGSDVWVQETLTFKDVEYATRPGNVDVMLTHDCPDGVDIPGITKTADNGWDAPMLAESQEHREVLRSVVDAVKPKLLVHGHYHIRYQGKLTGSDYETTVVGLDCDNRQLKDNLVLFDPDRIKGE